MTEYTLPEPLCRDDTEHNKDYYVAKHVTDAFAAGQRDMLERCVYVAEQAFRRALDGNEIADKLKELLNDRRAPM
jgi:hypothetical protein